MFTKSIKYLEYYRYLLNLSLIIIYFINKKDYYIIILEYIIIRNKYAILYFQIKLIMLNLMIITIFL